VSKKRIFTAINLPSEIKEKLISCQKEWEHLPVRWTPKENLHVTLVFIGSVTEAQTNKIKRVTEKVASSLNSFSVHFHNICLAPPNRPPRMFWVEGRRNKEIVELKKKLEKALVKVKNTGLKKEESRTYHPHITLGRINKSEWRNLKQQPQINKEISINVPVNSIDVMKSELKPSGAEYSVLKKFPLNKD